MPVAEVERHSLPRQRREVDPHGLVPRAEQDRELVEQAGLRRPRTRSRHAGTACATSSGFISGSSARDQRDGERGRRRQPGALRQGRLDLEAHVVAGAQLGDHAAHVRAVGAAGRPASRDDATVDALFDARTAARGRRCSRCARRSGWRGRARRRRDGIGDTGQRARCRDGRFAPSPTGTLHLGNLRTALLAWLFARSAGVALPDADRGSRPRPRRGPSYERRSSPTCAAIGIDWDGAVVRQSERLELLRATRSRSSTPTASSTRAGARARRSARPRPRRTARCPRAPTRARAAS